MHDVKQKLIDLIGSDCACVFLRTKLHKIIKIYYDLRDIDNHELNEAKIEDVKRNNLMNNVDELLIKKSLEEKLEICIKMGHIDFIDCYVVPNQNNTFTIVKVYYDLSKYMQ